MRVFKPMFVRVFIFLSMAVCLIGLFSISGCIAHKSTCQAYEGVSSHQEVTVERTSFSFSQKDHPFDVFSEYRILPGDVLDVLFQIRSWSQIKEFRIAIENTVSVKFVHAPELNETQEVRPDGKISLPYLGEVLVLGKSVAGLMKELKESYAKILKDPELYVTIPEFRSAIKELKSDLHTSSGGSSRHVTVRPDGYVTFPMIGDVFVANKTISEVSNILNEEYEKLISGLHVDLFLETHSGSSIYVIGMVAQPGVYQINKPTSILEAIALAGGFSNGAELRGVIVLRKFEDRIIATRVNVSNTLSLRKGTKLFYLEPDDIVYIPKTFINKAAELARELESITFFNGVNLSYDLNNDSNTRTVQTEVQTP